MQRPLWASTGTKNPTYRDVLYVEELIGSNTVNTMPPATIAAFEDHGIVSSTVERDLAAAQEVMRDLDAIGLPMRQVTDVLEQEGVTTFKTAFEDILQRLDEKRRALAREQAAQGNRVAARAVGSEGHSAEVAGANSMPGGEEPQRVRKGSGGM